MKQLVSFLSQIESWQVIAAAVYVAATAIMFYYAYRLRQQYLAVIARQPNEPDEIAMSWLVAYCEFMECDLDDVMLVAYPTKRGGTRYLIEPRDRHWEAV